MLYTYSNLKKESEGYFEDKASKFLAYSFNVYDEDEVKEALAKVQELHPKASHHCYAYRIGTDKNNYKANDDGEPSGSAGRPILGQIDSFGLSNVLCIVVRYYGGTNLGVSGLINAYKKAAQDSFEQAQITTREKSTKLTVRCAYTEVNDLFNQLKAEGISEWEEAYAEECSITFVVSLSKLSALQAWLENNNLEFTILEK